MADAAESSSQFQIFRAKDAPGLVEAGCMSIEPYSPVQRAGVDKAIAEGLLDGEEIRVLVNIPGFSLAHAWLKKDYPLPLHSHDSDCLYYIIAGSLKLGTETLGARDCFFVPADVPYTYRPGPDGVELLEFRHAQTFNFLNLARGEAFWAKAAEAIAANHGDWQAAVPPTARQSEPA